MEKQSRKISLGLTNKLFEPGVHICQIFNNDEERHSSLTNFIIKGLQTGENTSCFSERETEITLSPIFEKYGIAYKEVEKSGEFSLSKTRDVYFEGGKFDPERLLSLLTDFYKESLKQNRSGARVIGEMLPEIDHIPGGSRLLEYESKVSLLVKEFPLNAVCQYDARSFEGSSILEILKVHPYIIIRGSVILNPFFIQPEDFFLTKQ